MPGQTWANLHAFLNDLPIALLLASLIFEALGALLKRDALRAAAFWSLVAGVSGALLAAGAGLLAEGRIEQSPRAHDLIERHETLAFVVMGIFAALLLWRIVRRVLSKTEQTVYLTAHVLGVVLLLVVGGVGGKLVFEHGLGIPTMRLDSIRAERPAVPVPAAPDSTRQ